MVWVIKIMLSPVGERHKHFLWSCYNVTRICNESRYVSSKAGVLEAFIRASFIFSVKMSFSRCFDKANSISLHIYVMQYLRSCCMPALLLHNFNTLSSVFQACFSSVSGGGLGKYLNNISFLL